MCETSKKIFVKRSELQLKPTLCGGQSFRWRNPRPDCWIGVFRGLVWSISQKDDHVIYDCFGKSSLEKSSDDVITDTDIGRAGDLTEDAGTLLKSYLRLDVDLNHYYEIWSEADPYFREAAPSLFGIRILNQEVVENIFSFICSTNNNIKRITSMVEKLSAFYGEPIAQVENEKFYSFPKVENLARSNVETDLRNAGFGYRAKFIYQSACTIQRLGGSTWLENLKKMRYTEAKKELIKLPGVGAKVADCICLMSLGHMEAVPVDTHIFKVASTTYLPHLKKVKTLNDKVYNEIGDHFRSLHGNYAGWANTVLFCSDLKLV